jgi:molybdopterin-guanine dinucleotide biosynthesis protein B
LDSKRTTPHARAFCFVGDSGAGKTTLLVSVVAALRAAGARVAVVKHSQHFDDTDPPGKDSARLRAAGASRVVLASPERTLVFWDHAGATPSFADHAALAGDADLLLVESYASAGLPAIEVLRAALPRREPRLRGDPRWIGVACDFEPAALPPAIRRFSLEEPAEIARFLLRRATGSPDPNDAPRPPLGSEPS